MGRIEGDGEISFCGAIEMAGVITINFRVLKNGMADLALKSPIYIPGPVEPQFGPGRYIYFEGFSVDEHGKQHYMDVTVAYRQTSLRKSQSLSDLWLPSSFVRSFVPIIQFPYSRFLYVLLLRTSCAHPFRFLHSIK